MKKLAFLLAFLLFSPLAFAKDTIRVQVNFTIHTAIGDYSDALYYTLAEWDNVTDDQIAQAEQDRADAWVASVQAASEPVDEAPAQ